MRIGVIGGGQLAQMMALAGYPLGLSVVCLEPKVDCPASLVADVIVGDYDDPEKLQYLASQVDVITYEFENIPLDPLKSLASSIYPPLTALSIAQDRFQEKSFFDALNIPTTRYSKVDSLGHLQEIIAQIGVPVILKTRRWGYDGKGQYVIRDTSDIASAWRQLGDQSLLVENLVAFEREVSCIAVRSIEGEILFYPLVENQHRDGILRCSQAGNMGGAVESLAQEYMTRILTELNYVGVLVIEFFQTGEQLNANEMAPRVHNSGHWTIEGAQVSQFENHLRAITGLPLGSTAIKGRAAMLNFIGNIPDLPELLKIPEAHCHLYGKTPKPGRKLGHVTISIDDEKMYSEKLEELNLIIKEAY